MIQSLAVEPASVESANWRSSRYKHWVNGFIVDGDYWLIKINKRTFMRTEEYVWNEIIPPFPVPIDEGTPTLINPENPYYVWDDKPEQWHPCWVRWNLDPPMIISMVTGKILGRGTPSLSLNVVVWSGADLAMWSVYIWKVRTNAKVFFSDMGFNVTELVLPTKEEVINQLRLCNYWYSLAHSSSRSVQVESEKSLSSSEVASILRDRGPYTLAMLIGCGSLEETGPETWATVFSKGQKGRFVIGCTRVISSGEVYKDILPWQDRFFNYMRQDHYTTPAAFEESIVDHPNLASTVMLYEGMGLHTLTISASPSGAGYTDPPAGSHTYEEGVTALFSAYPYSGYEFDYWDIWVNDTHSTYQEQFAQRQMLADISLIARFRPVEKVYYTLKIAVFPVGGGYTQPSIGSDTYLEGLEVQVTAHPNPDWKFDYWQSQDGGKIYQPNIEVTMNQDWEVIAYFKEALAPPVTYTLTMRVSPSGGGYTNPSVGNHIYDEGASIQVTAYPNPGFEFDYWKAVVGGVESPPYLYPSVKVDIDADKQVTAYFKQVAPTTVKVTMQVSPLWSGITSPIVGTHIYNYGKTVQITAYPESGYVFDYWKINDDISRSNPASLLSLYKDVLVAAYFKQTPIGPGATVHITAPDKSKAGQVVGVVVQITNTTNATAYYIPVLRVNGQWAAEGGYTTITPGSTVFWNFQFIMPSLDAELLIECWCENAFPWHLERTASKVVSLEEVGKVAVVSMLNPTPKAFDYTAWLLMGTTLVLMVSVDFHLEAGESKNVSLPVTMPSTPGTYPVYVEVFSSGISIALRKADKDVVVI